MGLDERPTFTGLQAVWHHLMRLRSYGEEQWAQTQKAHHAKQQARRKYSAASSHTLQPKWPAQRCPAKGGAQRLEHHYATDFCATPMLMPGEKQGRQFLVLSAEELQEQRERGPTQMWLNFTPQARGATGRTQARPRLQKSCFCEQRGHPACLACTVTNRGVRR